jgi:F-type H+-transporting ATPase subunit a
MTWDATPFRAAIHSLLLTALAVVSLPARAAGEGGLHVVLKAEQIGSLWGFPITNSVVMTVMAVTLLLLFTWLVRSRLSLIPGKLQTGVEWLFESVLGYMESILEDKQVARRYFPLVMTIFLFLLVANELAFIPGVGSIFVNYGGYDIPLLRPAAADLNVGIALAIIAFVSIEVAGVAALGFYKYSQKYLNFTSPVNFAVGLIELISNVGRLISFSFRLFGNIFAGEVMLVVAAFFLAVLLPLPLMMFEVFVGFIQAVVFAMLTLFFIKLSMMEPHGKEAH